jgi:predicted AlkP superfamily phosphohydrolase/phosphomutase
VISEVLYKTNAGSGIRYDSATLTVRRLVFLSLFVIGLSSELRSQPRQRVIVVGFDGADAGYTEKWMNEGKLPNLARLRAEGTFRPLLPTTPAQTPVSWSTFSTGIDPGRTGIFDFLRRDPATYLPVFAAFSEGSEPFLLGENNRWAAAAVAALFVFAGVALLLRLKFRWATAFLVALIPAAGAAYAAAVWAESNLPKTLPTVVNHRQGIPMWDVAAEAGFKTSVLHIPVTFPATDLDDGHMLSGLGVPDVSGRIGKPFYFTSELDLQAAASNEFSIEIVQLEDNRGVITAPIVGPPNKLFEEPKYIQTEMTLTVAEDRQSLQIEVGNQKFTMRPGQWSDWVEFTFPFNSLIKVSGVSRFHLLQVQPEIKLYLSPVNFDPRHLPPGFRISTPVKWAPQLAEQHGLYKTIGWAIDTWAISAGFATEQMFWDDMVWTVEQYRKIYRQQLEEGDDDLYIHQFEFTDRVAHVFWRAIDPLHPAYDSQLAAKWGGSIEKSYVLMDQIVGEAMQAAEKSGSPADHHVRPWVRQLPQSGELQHLAGAERLHGAASGVQAGERNLELLFDQGQFWENVDWSKTRAYAMGLGELYVNLRGREAQGIVAPGAEYDALKLELKTKLEAMVDPETGERPVSRVISREQAYRAFDPNVMPDLFITNTDGYRVSWQTSLGGVQKDLIEPNNTPWSGDHCSLDPELVKGIFFVNRKLTTDRAPYIADIYPTVLAALGLKAPYELDGVALK